MDISDLIEEVYDSGPRAYQAYSSPPRKDFVPYSTKDGYNFPYQKNAPPLYPPTAPQPENPVSFPWPLQTINDDLSDAFIFSLAAYKKIANCIKENPTLTQEEKDGLFKLFKKMGAVLNNIKEVGVKLPSVVNLAEQPPPQIPVAPAPIKPEHPFI